MPIADLRFPNEKALEPAQSFQSAIGNRNWQSAMSRVAERL
jgi:hypothetical protein